MHKPLMTLQVEAGLEAATAVGEVAGKGSKV